MARKAAPTKAAGAKKPKRAKSPKAAKSRRPKAAEPKQAKAAKSNRSKPPSELVSEFLESPLVADTLAAGAAAALAVFVQQGLSRRREGDSSKLALKQAGKAAAAAMGTRLAEEFDAIMKRAEAKAKPEEK